MRLLVTLCNQVGVPSLSLVWVDTDAEAVTLVETPGLIGSGYTGAIVDGDVVLVAEQHADRAAISALDKDLRVVRTTAIPRGAGMHSILFEPDTATLLATSTQTDELLAVPWGPKAADIPVETRWDPTGSGRDTQHLSSVATWQGRTIVSALGPREPPHGHRWHGYIADATTGEHLADDLHYPHSLVVRGDDLLFLEAVGPRIVRFTPSSTTSRTDLPIDGFARGLAVVRDRIIVGTSRRREASRSGQGGLPPFPAGPCALHVLDADTLELERTIDLTGYGREIFDVVVLPDDVMPAQEVRCRVEQRADRIEGAYIDFRRLVADPRTRRAAARS